MNTELVTFGDSPRTINHTHEYVTIRSEQENQDPVLTLHFQEPRKVKGGNLIIGIKKILKFL